MEAFLENSVEASMEDMEAFTEVTSTEVTSTKDSVKIYSHESFREINLLP